ncbi:MAG TPA: HAD-IA family hydrolase [Pseudonocardiaceae bacterium]|nr:HAD-IA family hydrolase [Pseudonocardiaceae bacterium]
MNLSHYDALSFDCYGTLIDWEQGIGSVLSAWAHEAGLEPDRESLLRMYAVHETRTEREAPTMLYSGVLAASFTALGEELGTMVSPEWAARLGASVPDWPAFPDSHDALSALGSRYPLIILSNVHRAGFAASARRLDVSFDHILTAEDIGSYKPAARNFDALNTLCAQIGIGEGRLLHVAQSLFHDHLPAKAAGIPTVWINRRSDRPGWGATPQPTSEVSPDWEYPSLAAFAEACRLDAAPAG